MGRKGLAFEGALSTWDEDGGGMIRFISSIGSIVGIGILSIVFVRGEAVGFIAEVGIVGGGCGGDDSYTCRT